MSSRLETFQLHADAVDALRNSFGYLGDALVAGESLSLYELTTEVELNWLKQNLSPLARSLLSARFRLVLMISVYDFQAQLRIRGDAAKLEIDCENACPLEDTLGLLPDEAVVAFEELQKTLQPERAGLYLIAVYDLLEALAGSGATIALQLRVFLDKTSVSRSLVTNVNENIRPSVVSYLFPEALMATLSSISLARFEEEFCKYGRRTVIPIFGFTGCIMSDLLAICGPGHESKADTFLTKPLSEEVLEKAKKSLAFRQAESLWVSPTKWLIPDAFAMAAELPATNNMEVDLCRQLKSFQALLSAIFLADYVEFRDDRHWVEYRGLGRAGLPIERATLLEYETHLETLYQLYAYAYDGYRADKLEIAQQFASLMAVNLAALCERAAEIRDMTKKTFDRGLVEKVKDYFDARHKIQERIKTAVAETSNSVIALSRDVSGDVYKIAGVIAGAVVGALLKPDFTLWAALAASLVIAVYMELVMFYYLRTLKQAYDLRMTQHSAYIQSFEDILRSSEIQTFVGDEQLGKAQALFSDKYSWASAIYLVFLLIAMIVACISIYMLFWSVPSASFPQQPTPTV